MYNVISGADSVEKFIVAFAANQNVIAAVTAPKTCRAFAAVNLIISVIRTNHNFSLRLTASVNFAANSCNIGISNRLVIFAGVFNEFVAGILNFQTAATWINEETVTFNTDTLIIAGKLNLIARLIIADSLIAAAVDKSVALTDDVSTVIINTVINIGYAVVGVSGSAVIVIGISYAAANAGISDTAADTALKEHRTVDIFKTVIFRAVVAVITVIGVSLAVIGIGIGYAVIDF